LRALDLPAAEIEPRGRKKFFRYVDEDVQLLSLAGILGLQEPSASPVVWTVLTESGGRRIGLQVDALLGHRKAFVKTLNFPLNQLTGLSGATIEGDGHVVFIIDPQSLLDGRQELAAD
jgi:two-component system chemotaxis sensor kinase CheA